MRKNPLHPSVRVDGNYPLGDLRVALEGVSVAQEAAARKVANVWASTMVLKEQAPAYEFYTNVLVTWLPSKAANTRRSYAGTLVSFLDFVSRKRYPNERDLKLVAPHQLRQDDIDAYVEHLTRPAVTAESIKDKTERVVFEWIQDKFESGSRRLRPEEIRQGMKKEGLLDMVSIYTPKRGFDASPSRGYDKLDLVISSLARKRVLKRDKLSDQEIAALPEDERDYSYMVAPVELPTVNRAATQLQRIRALSSFWTHMLTDKKLGLSRKPSALETVNPWKEKDQLVSKGDPGDPIRKLNRKLRRDDLKAILMKLGKDRLERNGGFLRVANILAARDEMAIYFYASTGIRREEGMQARVENIRDPQGIEAVDPNKSLLAMTGIRRKGRKSEETIFLPRSVMDFRRHLFEMMRQFVNEGEAFEHWIRGVYAEKGEESSKELRMALTRRGHYQKTFDACLKNAARGPLVPAIGRWGNAILKAEDKAKRMGISTPNEDLSQVPMDGRNLLSRMQELAGDKPERRLKYHPHALRHMAVELAEGVGMGAVFGQALAGHRSKATTDIYRDMVSLQAEAVLRASHQLNQIFLEVEEKTRAPEPVEVAGAAEIPEIPEAPQAPESEQVPVEEPVTMEQVGKSLVSTFEKTEEVKRSLIEAIRENMKEMSVESLSDAARIDSAAKDKVYSYATENSETTVQPGLDKVNAHPTQPVAVGGPLPGQGGKKGGGKKKSERASKDAVEKMSENLARVPADDFSMTADNMLAGNGWREPVYMGLESLRSTFADGNMVGPQVVTRYGFQDDKKLSLVTSIRTYVPFIYYFSRPTSDKAGTAIAPWSPDKAGVHPIEQMKKNASGRIVSSRPKAEAPQPEAPKSEAPQPEPPTAAMALPEQPKVTILPAYTGESKEIRVREKKERADVAYQDRLIYLPVLNLGDREQVESVVKSIDLVYSGSGPKGRLGMRVTNPDKAKSMVRWTTIMFTMSRRVNAEMAKRNVKWVGPSEILSKMGESADDFLKRTAGKVLRSPEPDMVSSFLVNEGGVMHGRLGHSFRIEDELGRTNLVESTMDQIIERAEEFSEGKFGAYLAVYDLPPWITSDDPIGELPDKEIDTLKAVLREFTSTMGEVLEFTGESKELSDMWRLVADFSNSSDRTVLLSKRVEDAAMKFNRENQVDLLLGVRRVLRHLWELKKENANAFRFRNLPDVAKLKKLWGVFWSWVLPSTEMAKARLLESKATASEGAIRGVYNAFVSEIYAQAMFENYEEMVANFASEARQLVESDLSSAEISERIKNRIMEISAIISKNLDQEDFVSRMQKARGGEGLSEDNEELMKESYDKFIGLKKRGGDVAEPFFALEDLKEMGEDSKARAALIIASIAVQVYSFDFLKMEIASDIQGGKDKVDAPPGGGPDLGGALLGEEGDEGGGKPSVSMDDARSFDPRDVFGEKVKKMIEVYPALQDIDSPERKLFDKRISELLEQDSKSPISELKNLASRISEHGVLKALAAGQSEDADKLSALFGKVLLMKMDAKGGELESILSEMTSAKSSGLYKASKKQGSLKSMEKLVRDYIGSRRSPKEFLSMKNFYLLEYKNTGLNFPKGYEQERRFEKSKDYGSGVAVPVHKEEDVEEFNRIVQELEPVDDDYANKVIAELGFDNIKDFVDRNGFGNGEGDFYGTVGKSAGAIVSILSLPPPFIKSGKGMVLKLRQYFLKSRKKILSETNPRRQANLMVAFVKREEELQEFLKSVRKMTPNMSKEFDDDYISRFHELEFAEEFMPKRDTMSSGHRMRKRYIQIMRGVRLSPIRLLAWLYA